MDDDERATRPHTTPAEFGTTETGEAVLAPFGGKNPDPGAPYRAAFPVELKAAIVATLRKSYAIVQETHEVSLGFNAMTFGYGVYHVGWFQFQKVCEQSAGAVVRVEELNLLKRFQSGEYTFGFYKVGHTAGENIWDLRPTSENGAMSVDADGQPVLLGLEDAMLDRVDALRYAVVAHLGNPTDGLCAVYLCVPVETLRGKILRWGFVEELFVADSSVGTVGRAANEPPPEECTPQFDSPREEPEGDVVVRLKAED